MIATSSPPPEHPSKLRSKGLTHIVTAIKRQKSPYDVIDQYQLRQPSDNLPSPPPLPPKESPAVTRYESRAPCQPDAPLSPSPRSPSEVYPHHKTQSKPQAPAHPAMQKRSVASTTLIPATTYKGSFTLSGNSRQAMSQPTHPAQDIIVIRPSVIQLSKDPKERARLRLELQKQRAREEEELLREEAERQARIKAQKEEMLRRAEEEAERRRAKVEKERQLAIARRQRKEFSKQAEDEQAQNLLEERRLLERQKRAEESRKLEEWRYQQSLKAEEAKRASEFARKQEEEVRKSKLERAKRDLEQAKVPMTKGWVTVQLDESLIWRRRFFKFSGTACLLYKSAVAAEAGHRPLDTLELRDQVSRFCEWSDGHEELKALPSSFAVEFKDGHTWSMFTDTETEKFMLIVLLQQAAGI